MTILLGSMHNDTKECFRCKKQLELANFESANKFVLRIDKNRCRVCTKCEFERAVNDLSIIGYNKKFHSYDVFKFANKQEVINYFIHVKNLKLCQIM